MQDFQKPLVEAWTDYVAGRLDAKALKGRSAGFGIYQQRDDRTMMRVRRVGGRVTADDLRHAAALLRAHGGSHVHLTTRQDLQLHGIPAAHVTAALAAAGFDSEENLMSRVRDALAELRTTAKQTRCLDYVLNSPTWNCKGNFFCYLHDRNENTIVDPAVIYFDFSNPFYKEKA